MFFHRAHVQASLAQDLWLIRTYQLETDAACVSRQERLVERNAVVQELTSEYKTIL
jgi:hypothetical protein